MEVEKTMLISASPEKLWALLLDPSVMGGCVPGIKSIEVVSPTEYRSEIHVKISFIAAKFKMKTTIVEQRPPNYLHSTSVGEDASVASSIKQNSEIFLTAHGDGQTELRMKFKVDVIGRLGTFGLTVMKTKADRMWEEFSQNLLARLQPPALQVVGIVESIPTLITLPEQIPAAQSSPIPSLPTIASIVPAHKGWFARAFGSRTATEMIEVDVQRGDTRIKIRWPTSAAPECVAWLHSLVDSGKP